MKIESDLKANSIKQIGDELRQFTKKIEKQKILRATYEQVQIVIKELYIAIWHKINGCCSISLTFLREQFKERNINGQILRDGLVNTISKAMEKLISTFIKEQPSELFYGDLSQKESHMLESLLLQRNSEVKGCQITQMVDKLKKRKLNAGERQKRTFQPLSFIKNKVNQISEELFDLRRQAKNKFFSINPKLKTKIIPEKDEESVNFILDSLHRPSTIELLFRASQHKFSADMFHKKCDNISNTFTLIKTQFGNVLGGYTPQKWSSLNFSKIDLKYSTFLLSVNHRHKFRLINSEFAIRCSSDQGPIFGQNDEDYDLFIAKKCHQDRKCYADFPSNFNSTGFIVEDRQKAKTAVFGSIQNKYFNIVEYEVYKVTWV